MIPAFVGASPSDARSALWDSALARAQPAPASGLAHFFFAALTAHLLARRRLVGPCLAIALLCGGGCVSRPRSTAEAPPPLPREFRAVWVATVNNIDWPSKRGLSVAQQRAEMNAILDRARSLNLNAVIFQVRPAADALYESKLEPWSEYLTGTQGRDPGYDPLAEWIAGAHARGLELHAWLNPYRARHAEAKSPLAPNHLSKTHPHAVKAYGKLLWMDPGEPVAAERTLAVVRDIVTRYDVDGIHIDDYFYPYPIEAPNLPKDVKENLDFPDEPAWKRYRQAGGKLNRADWRRQNVDHLVEKIHRTIREAKPLVKFGISPFGLGKPALRPPGITGFSQYDSLYADAELWLQKGWLDYFTPQLYWPIAKKEQSYPVLLDYWLRQNPKNRHIWPGLFTSRIDHTAESWPAEEITAQITLTRTRPDATGHVHFSAVALMEDRKGIAQKLAPLYATPALVPATPWLDHRAPPAPTLRRDEKLPQVVITPSAGEAPVRYAVWRQHGTEWRLAVQIAAEKTVSLAPDAALGPVTAVAVQALDRTGNASAPAMLALSSGRANRPGEPSPARGSSRTTRSAP